ncbi:uncharacterized protein BcabD6B2_26630 [Babesia caballi]|uniref:Uncharacterized protein n=1 Tax=Babesia caballi TaxID=5871 RepID=A0AAV4LTZ2_BABCB|nr:hypothetical protein BcabD6B2_26630 [Babesia caballi]
MLLPLDDTDDRDHDNQGYITTTPPTTDYITVPISLLLTTALGENYVTLSRQKGAHKGGKAAEVEAVGTTAQGGDAREAGEGGGGGAGGLDGVKRIRDTIVTDAIYGGKGEGYGVGSFRKKSVEEGRVGNVFDVCFGELGEAGFQITNYFRGLFAIVEHAG